jgi:uncharacterized protein (TIGR02996 family)
MNTSTELLARVAADPASNEVRLACAEALSATDAPRAELIRAQVALTGKLDPARRRTLTLRVEALLQEHGRAWTEPLKEMGATQWRFTRGFIEELWIPEARLAKHGAELLAREPLRRLWLETHDGKGVAQAGAQPWFERFRWLHLTGDGVDAGAQALAGAPHAGHLETLLMSSAGSEGGRAVAGSTALSGLRALSASIQDEKDAQALASGKLALKRLFLSGASVGDEGAEVLAKGKALGALEVLALNRNEISDEGAQALAKSKALASLERLELSGNELSEEGALAFRSPKALPRLRRLELEEMGLSTRQLEPLRKRLGAGLKL